MEQLKRECNLCADLLVDIQKETGKYKRDFEQIVKNQDCLNHYVCLPLIRLKEKQNNVSIQ
jgi:hypothetical protein